MRYKGFTLAEVLITLVIIGVIAAMTVPTLMNNTNSEEFRSALKKAISTTNQALSLNFALDGLTAQDYTSNEDLVENLFKKRMNTMDDGENSVFTNGCEGGKTFTTIDGTIFCVSSDFLSDTADTPTSPCNYQNTVACIAGGEGPNLWIDVNGEKKPNKLTLSSDHPRDIYTAQIFAQKVVPYGAPTQGVMYNKTVSTDSIDENQPNGGDGGEQPNTPSPNPDTNNPEVNNPDAQTPEENIKPNENEESLKDKQDKLEEEKKQKEEEKNNLDQALKDIEDELAWLEKEEERLEEEEDRLEDKYDNVEDKLEDAEREAQKKKLQEQLNKIKEKIEENERQQDIIEDRQDVLEEEQERIEEEQERIEDELEKIEKEQNKLEQESQKDHTESKPG